MGVTDGDSTWTAAIQDRSIRVLEKTRKILVLGHLS